MTHQYVAHTEIRKILKRLTSRPSILCIVWQKQTVLLLHMILTFTLN